MGRLDALDYWRCAGNLAELWWTRHAGLPWESLAAHRLQLLVRHARRESPFDRRHYSGLAPSPDLHELPPVTKAELMGAFDRWCTDREVTLASARDFLDKPGMLGQRYLGRYVLWKSSGTSGTPGIFVQDGASLAVYDALVGVQLDAEPFAAAISRLATGASRAALVVATNDHFASIASWLRMASGMPGMETRAFSVLDPLPVLAAELDAFKPDFLAAYPSVLSMLAAERHAGRLRASPALLWSGGETLSRPARTAIQSAFHAPVLNEYGASECLSIGSECELGWMHLNAEWVILEGIDAQGRPVPPHVPSDRVLLTNLANWLQPVIRYELDDRIVRKGTPCACGDSRPAFRVEGRHGQVLHLAGSRGDLVPVAPLAIETVVEEASGDSRFQVAQTGWATLVLRHDAQPGDWKRAGAALREFLAARSLGNVRVHLEATGPHRDPRSGKMHSVVIECHGR